MEPSEEVNHPPRGHEVGAGRERAWRHFSWIFVGAFVLWLTSWALIHWLAPGPEQAGQFGDQFGAVNALFSGLAFAGVIVAILLQSEELRLQRQELRQTREEMSRSREEAARAAGAQENLATLSALSALSDYYQRLHAEPRTDSEQVRERLRVLVTMTEEIVQRVAGLPPSGEIEVPRPPIVVQKSFAGAPQAVLALREHLSSLGTEMAWVHSFDRADRLGEGWVAQTVSGAEIQTDDARVLMSKPR